MASSELTSHPLPVAAPVEDFLDWVGREEPAPGGGSVAAIVVASAAALAEKAARFSRSWEGAEGVIVQARLLRARAERLAQEDADAYEEVLTAMRLPKELEQEGRDATLGKALERAADIPARIVALALDVAHLCEEVAREGNANLRPDAAAGALLCEGAARACMNLVAVNLRVGGDDERMKALDEITEDVRRAGRRVLGTPEG